MSSKPEVPNWQKLGFQQDFLDAVVRNEEASLELWWDGPPPSADDVEAWASSAISDGACVFAMGSMGYAIPNPPLKDWREVGCRVVRAGLHYFFGRWRENFKWLLKDYDRAKARAELPWSDSYRWALATALSLSDWAAADKLLQWPGEDLQFDEGTDDRTGEDCAYQIWLALQLRGGSSSAAASRSRKAVERATRRQQSLAAAKALRRMKMILPQSEVISAAAVQRQMIDRGSRRRPKLLIAAADALLAMDAPALKESLEAYLRHYRQRELRTNRPDYGVCWDATALWHLARHRGLGEIALSEEFKLLIARP